MHRLMYSEYNDVVQIWTIRYAQNTLIPWIKNGAEQLMALVLRMLDEISTNIVIDMVRAIQNVKYSFGS